MDADLEPDLDLGDGARRRAALVGLGVLAVAVLAISWWMWRGDGADEDEVRGDRSAGVEDAGVDDGDAAGSLADPVVRVRLEPMEGFFIEGFEIGLRFETGDGEVLEKLHWTDFVQTLDRDDIEAYYDAVYELPVPAGDVVVRADAEIGPAGPPVKPDLDGDLPCVVELAVEPGDVATLEVNFSSDDGCLTLVSVEPAADPEAPATTATTDPDIPASTPTTMPTSIPTTAPTAPTVEETTTTSEPIVELLPGTAVYVDIDLDCRAFRLNGEVWVVVEGDVRSWQPADEAFEGGTLTIDDEGRGTFRGDAAGSKVATFRLLGPGEDWNCAPRERP